jgi:uncharacterized membrane protein YiaA
MTRRLPLELVNVDLVVGIVVGPFVAVLWLCMAWVNGKGYDWARLLTVFLFTLGTAEMVIDLAQDSAAYAPAAVIAYGVEWLIGLAAVALIFWKQSWPYYVRQPAAR